MQKTKFAAWLEHELNRRGMKPADLARDAGLARATISNIIHGMRGPGPETVRKIAAAFEYDPEFVMEQAGLLPESTNPEQDVTFKELLAVVKQLTVEEREEVLDYVLLRRAQKKKRASKTNQASVNGE